MPIDDLEVEVCHFGKVDGTASVVCSCRRFGDGAPDFAADFAESGHC